MAVCGQDIIYKDYATNPIPTSFFTSETILLVTKLLRRAIFEPKKIEKTFGEFSGSKSTDAF